MPRYDDTTQGTAPAFGVEKPEGQFVDFQKVGTRIASHEMLDVSLVLVKVAVQAGTDCGPVELSPGSENERRDPRVDLDPRSRKKEARSDRERTRKVP